jgi:hypothetical protein
VSSVRIECDDLGVLRIRADFCNPLMQRDDHNMLRKRNFAEPEMAESRGFKKCPAAYLRS